MKSSEILRKAARMIEGGYEWGGCDAIWSIPNSSAPAVCRAIVHFKHMQPEQLHGLYWWPITKRHGPRIIGLCLAAAIAESEGD